MVQMGDPTGTGAGGESIWGKPFKDEVHGRIKFNHRGQVAMANSNKPNSNQSQFFITLDSCDWLQGKHTIFGKVTGNTIYNVTRMGEVEVGEMDRPVDDIRILRMEVLLNPFEDIVPRYFSPLHNSITVLFNYSYCLGKELLPKLMSRWWFTTIRRVKALQQWL